ncbi:139_t:CDS:2 [Ambispora leptoticha]|uniref:139_t:CDS:1 n=1 Tax=Ambispora leptoticha TaxID=144679 RepID=A0A9N9AQX4_9GLOM|nr:139_t:CDS:2 [Ambispora leptoticha]
MEETINILSENHEQLEEKRNKERETKLHDLLNTKAEIIRSGDTNDRQRKITSLQNELSEIANDHGHKEFEEELTNLCQVQIELTKSQVELENSRKQQSQIQIPPKGNH